MMAEVEQAIKSYQQWFGSYKSSGALKKVHVWLTLNNGNIEFLSSADSYKVKRIKRNPRVISFIGSEDGPAIYGTAEIIKDQPALRRIYNGYWKTHPFLMLLLAFPISKRIKQGKQIGIRIRPDEPNPVSDITTPAVER